MHTAAKERLERLVNGLNHGWDGYQGKAVNVDNAACALEIIMQSCNAKTPMPQIVPGSHGDVQLEWHTNEVEMEIHIRAEEDIEAWIMHHDSGEETIQAHDASHIIRLIQAAFTQEGS